MYNKFVRKIIAFSIFLFFLLFFAAITGTVSYAADIRTNNTIIIPEDEKNLKDLYLFGSTIEINAPVRDDVVSAGRDIAIDNNVSGNINAAGSTVRVKGDTGGSVRTAGGNVVIDGRTGHDLVIAGGTIVVTKTSVVNGDLIVAGGDVTIDGNVNGKVMVQGGQVKINGMVNKNVEGNIGKLTIGPNAVIGGDLHYSSPEKAEVSSGATIKGTTHYTRVERPQKTAEKAEGLISGFSFYKLIGDIILSILFIYFLSGILRPILKDIADSAFINGITGFAFLVLMPIISIFLLILLWLGIASFLIYFLVLFLGVYVAKIFNGWMIMRWWYGRDKREYVLDWKAGVAGPIVLFLVGLVPFIGWLVIAILYLISFGAIVRSLVFAVQAQRMPAKKK